MKDEINKNKLGLVAGIFLAILHAFWAIIVAVGVAQTSLDWIFPMHFVNSTFSVATFNIGNALILIVLAFVGGYVSGWIFACLWNFISKR